MNEIELAKKLWELEQEKKKLSDKLDMVQSEYKVFASKLTEHLTSEGKKSTGLIEGVGEFSLKRSSYMSVTKEHMPYFIGALKRWGDGALIKESVEAATLKKYLEMKLEGVASDIESCRDSGGVAGILGYILQEFPDAHESESIQALTVDEIDLMPGEKLAAMILQAYSVSVFQDVKLSHTKRGK